ncbi:hypothetical protein V6Z12_A04G181000 [Gossypium hirsutum]
MVMIHNCLGKSKVNLVVLTMKFAMAMLMSLAHLFLSLVRCTSNLTLGGDFGARFTHLNTEN